MCRNPVPVASELLTVDSIVSIEHASVSGVIKRADCSFYNECLDVAIDGEWENFGCHSCTAYAAMDREQQRSDIISLLAVDKAAEQMETFGKIDRRRGVKPGADAKVRARKPQLVNREEIDGETVVMLAVI